MTPTELERRVGEGAWLVELLLPRIAAAVVVQTVLIAAVFALLLRPARSAGLVRL